MDLIIELTINKWGEDNTHYCEWMNEWMNEWSEWMNGWMNEWISQICLQQNYTNKVLKESNQIEIKCFDRNLR